MLKVQSASAVMFHYLPGQHRHVAEWHNEVHRPEIQGAVPGVFYSQDFVAPPAYIAAREHADLPMAGGEYLSVYWSEGSLERLGEDNRKASQARRDAGSYHPFQDVVWAARLRTVGAYSRPGLGYDVNAAPLTPNSGLVLIAERIVDATRAAEYTDWLHNVHFPRVLGLGPFSACFEFVQDHPSGALMVQFWFIDRSDPLESLLELQRNEKGWRAASMDPTSIESLRSRIFRGAYQPVVTGTYDVYE
jgi:hypothetical protein